MVEDLWTYVMYDLSTLIRMENIMVVYVIFKYDIDKYLGTEYSLVVEDLDSKMRIISEKALEFLDKPSTDTTTDLINTFVSAIKCISILQCGLDTAFAKGVISNDVYNNVKRALDAIEQYLKEKMVYVLTYR